MQSTQLTLALDGSIDRGRAGAARAAKAAEKKCIDWLAKAHRALLSEVQKHSHQDVFTIEQLRVGLAGVVEDPSDLRAWGAVTIKAIAERHIVKTGEYAPAASSNGSPKPLYRRGGGV